MRAPRVTVSYFDEILRFRVINDAFSFTGLGQVVGLVAVRRKQRTIQKKEVQNFEAESTNVPRPKRRIKDVYSGFRWRKRYGIIKQPKSSFNSVIFADMPLTDAASVTPGVIVAASLSGFLLGFPCACLMIFFYLKKKKTSIPSSPHYMSAKQNPYITVPLHDRPAKKQCASTSNNILNNFHNGTLKSKCYDYDTATIKRNSHSLNNGHSKQDDDKLFG